MKQTGTYSRLCKEGRYANALCPTDFNFSQVKTLQKKRVAKRQCALLHGLGNKQLAFLFSAIGFSQNDQFLAQLSNQYNFSFTQ